MDLLKIKQFVKQSGEHKFIFVENGEPEMVVMSFQEYERLTQREERGEYEMPQPTYTPHSFRAGAPELQSSGDVVPLENPQSVNERLRREFQPPEFEPFHRNESIGLPVHLEDLRLEDLPV